MTRANKAHLSAVKDWSTIIVLAANRLDGFIGRQREAIGCTLATIGNDKRRPLSAYYLGGKRTRPNGDSGSWPLIADILTMGKSLCELVGRPESRIRELAKDDVEDLLGELWTEHMADPALAVQAYYGFTASVVFGCAVWELHERARMGDERALMQLVSLDKTVVAEEWCAILITRRYYEQDWAFMRRLGRAVGAHVEDSGGSAGRMLMIVAMFWHCGLKEMTYEEIHAILSRAGMIDEFGDTDTMRRFLNRAGIRKPRYNRKTDKTATGALS